MGRAKSLIVWAIAEGRKRRRAVDRYLGGVSDCCRIPPPRAPLT